MRFSKPPKLFGPNFGCHNFLPILKTFPSMKFCNKFALSYLEIRYKRIAVLEMAFRTQKVFGTFDKQAPGLKTGVKNGMFSSKIGSGLENWAVHPYQEFRRVTPWVLSCFCQRHLLVYVTCLIFKHNATWGHYCNS